MDNSVMFGILTTLLNSGKVTVKELSLKYEVSKRTVLRYINSLCAAGIPLLTHQGRNGGVSIDENYTLNRVFFTEEELKRLYDCVNGMYGLLSDNITRSVRDKIGCLTYHDPKLILATDTVLIDSGAWGDLKVYKSKLTALEMAVSERKEAEIVYHDVNGVESVRTIQPYTLVFKKGLWYVYAFCLLRVEFRMFKIGRIASITVSENGFERQNIDIKNLPYNIKWFESEENVNLVLEISTRVRSEIEEWLSFENVKRNRNGKLYAFARLPENGLIQKLLSFGNSIKVIEPKSIKQKLLNTVSGIEKLYLETD